MLEQLVLQVWSKRFLLAAGAALSIIVSLFLYFALPHAYRAEMVIAPVGGKLQIPENIAGAILGSLADSRDGTTLDVAVFAMTSAEAARGVMKNAELMRALGFGSWNWFPSAKWLSSRARQKLGRDANPPVMEVRDRLRDVVKIEKESGGLVTVTVDLPRQESSVQLLELLAAHADGQLRKAKLARATEQVRYLERVVRQTQLPQLQESLSRVLLEQINTQLMAESEAPYSLFVMDGPVVDVKPRSPSLPKLLLISFISIEFLLILWIALTVPSRDE